MSLRIAQRRLDHRGGHGHSPDCPYAHDRPAATCGICRSERLERTRPALTLVPNTPSTKDERPAELRACTGPGCHRPTDHPTHRCDRCQETPT